jgi:hypothetical protein
MIQDTSKCSAEFLTDIKNHKSFTLQENNVIQDTLKCSAEFLTDTKNHRSFTLRENNRHLVLLFGYISRCVREPFAN